MKIILSFFLLTAFTNSYAFKLTFSKPIIKNFSSENDPLKLFKLDIRNYELLLNDGAKRLGTTTYISYRTDDISQLENYAVVQFIKGCVFLETTDENPRRAYFSRNYSDGHRPLHHSDWEVDSYDDDPIYPSDNTYSSYRHAFYKWTPKQGDYTNYNDSVSLIAKPAPHPEIFATDRPAQAYVEDNIIKNISLKFKTCIYKTRDITTSIGDFKLSPKDAIACHDWNSSYVYNKDLKKYENPIEIHPFCLIPSK